MAITITCEFERPYEILDDLSFVSLRLRSLSSLLHSYLHLNDVSAKDDAGGISSLLDVNVDILDAIHSTLTDELRKLDTDGPAVSDMEIEIAVAAGVADRETAKSILELAAGVRMSVAQHARRPADLRDEIIADKLTEGISESDISQAVNVRKSVVERVKRKIEGDDDEAAQQTGKAVNG